MPNPLAILWPLFALAAWTMCMAVNIACRRVRATPAGELVPIIMLTGLDDSESVEQAFDAGATDFISKPINWTLLRFRIRYVLRSAQLLKELVRNKESLSSAQRIARLGSWEWFVPTDEVQRSTQYYRLFGQSPQRPVEAGRLGRVVGHGSADQEEADHADPDPATDLAHRTQPPGPAST